MICSHDFHKEDTSQADCCYQLVPTDSIRAGMFEACTAHLLILRNSFKLQICTTRVHCVAGLSEHERAAGVSRYMLTMALEIISRNT